MGSSPTSGFSFATCTGCSRLPQLRCHNAAPAHLSLPDVNFWHIAAHLCLGHTTKNLDRYCKPQEGPKSQRRIGLRKAGRQVPPQPAGRAPARVSTADSSSLAFVLLSLRSIPYSRHQQAHPSMSRRATQLLVGAQRAGAGAHRTLATLVDPSSSTSTPTVYKEGDVRHNWRRSEIQRIFDSPLLSLIHRAQTVHQQNHDPGRIQLCTLMNIKTGGCSEDCKYCSQSSRYETATKAERLVQLDPVIQAARKAKENGSTRFCMGAAWRDLAGRKSGFERILTMVKEVRGMGMEGESACRGRVRVGLGYGS